MTLWGSEQFSLSLSLFLSFSLSLFLFTFVCLFYKVLRSLGSGELFRPSSIAISSIITSKGLQFDKMFWRIFVNFFPNSKVQGKQLELPQ